MLLWPIASLDLLANRVDAVFHPLGSANRVRDHQSLICNAGGAFAIRKLWVEADKVWFRTLRCEFYSYRTD